MPELKRETNNLKLFKVKIKMDIIKDFQEAIEIEYKKNLEDFDEQNLLPLDVRVAKGCLNLLRSN